MLDLKIEQSGNARIEWMDVYKGIMIILVVVGHATGKFNGWIYQFHMAAFFFASGYLSNVEKKNDLSVVVKKTLSILLPYFTLGIIGALINVLINNAGMYERLFGGSFVSFETTITRMFLRGAVDIQYWGTFWFLIALFGTEIFHIILYRLSGKRLNWLYFIFSTCCFFTGYWFVKNGIVPRVWIFEIDLILIAQMYFAFGLMLKKVNLGQCFVTGKKIEKIVVLIVAVTIAIWAKAYGVTVDYPSRTFNYPCAEFVTAIASIYIIYFVSKCIADYVKPLKNVLVICGKNSLGIMVLHFAFFKVFMFVLYKIGKASADQIINVVMPTELSNIYWLPLTIVSLLGSLVIWSAAIKIPVLKFLLGQDSKINAAIVRKIKSLVLLNNCSDKVTMKIVCFWNRIYDFVKRYKVFSTALAICIVLFAIPMYRTGIIINDELQARCLAMQGFVTFYKTEFSAWIGQGRLLAAPINSFTKYLSFIGAEIGTSFRIGSIVILLGTVIAFGIFLYRVLNNKYFATFASIVALSCMPIGFEHTSPNAFVGFIAFSFMLVLISLSFYESYIRSDKKKYAIIGMVLFFIAMMSYEAFITYTVLYLMIALGRTGIRNIKSNLKLYLIPCITAILFLICYLVSGKVLPSGYAGNQLGFDDITGPLKIIASLFIVCIPGFEVLFPRYQYYKLIYYNLGVVDYLRIVFFSVAFVILCVMLLKELTQKDSEEKIGKGVKNNSGKRTINIYIIFCGLCYMILPSLPNSISLMYQGIVGFNKNFLTLPVTFLEYFAAVFVLTFLIWIICKQVGSKFYIVLAAMLCLLVANIQQMNDIISKEQNSDFNRLTEIEAFLQTDTVRNLPAGEYYASDLYMQQNLLVIHNGYWSTYCNNVLGKDIQINKDLTEAEIGNIYYDGDNFTIVNSQVITVVSKDQENGVKAIQLADGNYTLFEFKNESIDNDFYVYSVINDGSIYSKEGYVAISGYNSDGWLERISKFTVTTGSQGLIHGTLYYPGTEMNDKEVSISVNGEVAVIFAVDENLLYFDLKTEPSETIDMTIECNFEYEDKGEDIRELSLILSNLTVE